jgi:acyl-CoA reductase-like NAD-dependent aldehyde dehydrogenase
MTSCSSVRTRCSTSIQLENGKARRHAFEEVVDVALTARYYAHTAEQYLRPKRRQGVQLMLTEVWEHHHPKGVVGIISPWNAHARDQRCHSGDRCRQRGAGQT